MKKLIVAVTLATVFAACNNKNNPSEVNSSTALTASDSLKMMRDSLKLDSFQRAELAAKEKLENEQAVQAAAAQQAAPAPAPIRTHSENRTVHYVNDAPAGQAVPAEPAKKGWSSAAKGAAIGAGAGAVTGLIVDKKNARGAIIGGVVGAGTGYAIGRSKDVKSGRVKKD